MAETRLLDGNEAVSAGAIAAGCRAFWAYPITPANEITEYMAREMPKVGGIFLQGGGENECGYLTLGGAAAGFRSMTATSGVGLMLMQEAITHMQASGVPTVIVEVTRPGPGAGGTQEAQTDYRHLTKGGLGAVHSIVLAPFSCQELFDFAQLAFYLAEKYLNLVYVLSGYILGHTIERVEIRTLDFGPLPPKDWAVRGKALRGGKSSRVGDGSSPGFGTFMGIREFHRAKLAKYKAIEENEKRYEAYFAEDAEILLVAYGSYARVALQATEWARDEGKKVGLFRPITLWPFPSEALKTVSPNLKKLLVVEDSTGEMVEDVEAIIKDQLPVHFLGVLARDAPGGEGVILPERVLDEINTLIK